MNARIQELAEQCYQIEDPHGRFPREVLNPEKFAELIVRECICQCDDENSQKYIMSHFGFTEKDWS